MPPQKEEAKNFTDCAEALDVIIDRFKQGELTLEDSLNLFEEGVGHLKVCQGKLTEARGKVDELIKTLHEDGESVTAPFEA